MALQSGGAISFYGFKLDCYGNVSIVNNTAGEGGVLNIHQADVTIDSNKHNNESIHANVVTFHRNTANILEGGSIRSISSNLTLKGSIQFVDNLAFCGGAIEGPRTIVG